MLDNIHIAIRSYKRPDNVRTFQHFPTAKIWVPESQRSAYAQTYGNDAIMTLPDAEDGNTALKSNWILSHRPAKWVTILDDDILEIGHWEGGKHVRMTPDQILAMIEDFYSVAEQLGVTLWGINQNKDPMIYNIARPFGFLAPVIGAWTSHLEHDMTYDVQSVPKDDYDFWLQTIKRNRRTFRSNKHHYLTNVGAGRGGAVSTRSYKRETGAIDYMVAKWGDRLFRPGGSAGGGSATGKNILNTFVRTSIPGV